MKRTPAQQRAVDSTAQNILVVAGPGSGKTATTVERINRLIDDGIDPHGIVALTFTNNAARELERRLGVRYMQREGAHEVMRLGYCGTLHGFALKMLKRHGAALGYGERTAIIDAEAADDLIESKAQTLGCKTRLADLLKLKAEGVPMTARPTPEQLVIRGYYDDLREAGMVDFDTLLSEFLRLLSTGPCGPAFDVSEQFTHLFVDEVQDSAALDWRIYAALPMANKFFVGDPDQAIYSFRGGDVSEMMKVSQRQDFEVIQLEQNFRSHSEICDAANRLIGHNTARIDKRTISEKGPGGYVVVIPEAVNEGDETAKIVHHLLYDCCPWMQDKPVEWLKAAGTPNPGFVKEIAVLARTNAIAAAFRKQLKASGIPVDEPARSTMPKDWPLARALVELLVNPENDTLAFFYILARKLARGEAAGVARMSAHQIRQGAARDGLSINQAVLHLQPIKPELVVSSFVGAGISREAQMIVAAKLRELPPDAEMIDLALSMASREPVEKVERQGVTVTTIHGAKGLEWDVVFLVGFDDEVIPGRARTPQAVMHRLDTMRPDFRFDPVEEERRLAYVAVTRARRALYISHAGSRTTSWGATEGHTPSRFIKELRG